MKLAELKDLVFGGWDIYTDSAYQAASKAGVLEAKDLDKAKKFLSGIKPMKAAFDQNYVKNLSGTNVKKGKTKFDLAEQIREDIRNFKKKNKLDRLVMVWCGSTEVFMKAGGGAQGSGVVREGHEGEPSGDCAVDAVCVCGDCRRSALREWRAEPDRGHSGAERISRGKNRCRWAARISKPGRR